LFLAIFCRFYKINQSTKDCWK